MSSFHNSCRYVKFQTIKKWCPDLETFLKCFHTRWNDFDSKSLIISDMISIDYLWYDFFYDLYCFIIIHRQWRNVIMRSVSTKICWKRSWRRRRKRGRQSAQNSTKGSAKLTSWGKGNEIPALLLKKEISSWDCFPIFISIETRLGIKTKVLK